MIWREKLVEFGLTLVLVMSGLVVTATVFFGLMAVTLGATGKVIPGLVAADSVPYVILVVISAAVGNTCAYFCFPYLIRFIFRGFELKDERLQRSMSYLISVTGMNILAERLYTIKSRTANAVVSGITSRARYVFFTDKLLDRMTEEEIIAIFAHELAHIRHRHILKTLLAVILWIVGVQALVYIIDVNAYFGTMDFVLQTSAYGTITMINVWLVMFLVVFPLSRRHEHEADATAAKWVGTGQYKKALYRLYQLNDNLKPPAKFVEVLQTHPSLQSRLSRVAELESQLGTAQMEGKSLN